MLNFFQGIKRLIAICLVMLLIVTSLTILPASARADNISIVKGSLPSIKSSKDLKETVKNFVPPNPFTEAKNILEDGFRDGVEGRDRSNQKAAKAGLVRVC